MYIQFTFCVQGDNINMGNFLTNQIEEITLGIR